MRTSDALGPGRGGAAVGRAPVWARAQAGVWNATGRAFWRVALVLAVTLLAFVETWAAVGIWRYLTQD